MHLPGCHICYVFLLSKVIKNTQELLSSSLRKGLIKAPSGLGGCRLNVPPNFLKVFTGLTSFPEIDSSFQTVL